jgi:peptidoglycan biosynthesis protein MviN/MurJ (putative lipid II flippase)
VSRWDDGVIERFRIAVLPPDHKRIALGAASVAGFMLIGKLAGAAKEMSVAWRYGVGEVVDAYQLATTIVFWLPGILVSVLSIVLVPMLVRLRQEPAEEREVFLQELQGLVVLVGVSLGLFSVLTGSMVLPYLAGKLSVSSHEMASQFTLGLAPAAPLVLLIGVYGTRLMAREQQLNTLLEGVPAVGIVLLVLAWSPGADIAPLIWGTLLGIGIQAFWLSHVARRTDRHTATFRLSHRSRHWSELYRAAGVIAVGQFSMSFITPLDQYTAAQFGDGTIATLGYAKRVIALLIGVGAVALSRATLPVMSDLRATGRAARAQAIALKWAVLMLAGGTVVAVVAWALAPWGIGVLFERGAFTSHDTAVVADVFRWGLVEVPFFFAGLVLVQLLASQGRYRTIACLGASNLVVKGMLNVALSAWMGIGGVLLATGLMYAWSAGCLYYAASRPWAAG